jgi:hypothetical protein
MRCAKAIASAFTIAFMLLGGFLVAPSFRGAAQSNATPASDSAEQEPENVTPVVGDPTLHPAIDLEAAQTTALSAQAGRVVKEVELNGEDGVLTYTIVLDDGTEVDIDATTGVVISTEAAGEKADDDEADDGESNDDGAEDGETDDDGADDGESHDDDQEEGENNHDDQEED